MYAEKEAVLKMIEKDRGNNKKSPPKVEVPPKRNIEVDKKQQIEANNFKLSKYKNVASKVKPLMEQTKVNQQVK